MNKVLLSVDESLLRRIDRKAAARGLSRSAYLTELARRDLAPKPPDLQATFERLERIFVKAPAENVTAAIRAERDAR